MQGGWDGRVTPQMFEYRVTQIGGVVMSRHGRRMSVRAPETEGVAMTERNFQIRLTCRYEALENSIVEMSAEQLDEGRWREFMLDASQPGFLIFVYAILNCQHLYMRENAAERGLVLASAHGSIEVVTNQPWEMQKLHVRFDVRLKSGRPAEDDVDYIVDRMQHCPVSVNLRSVPDSKITLDFS